MKKSIFMILCLLVVAMFLIGCVEKELTTEEEQALESELEQLSEEELNQVIEEGESEESKALAGQAYRRRSFGKYSYKPSMVLKTAYKIQSKRVVRAGIAYVLGESDYVYAFDIATGKEKWAYSTGDGFIGPVVVK